MTHTAIAKLSSPCIKKTPSSKRGEKVVFIYSSSFGLKSPLRASIPRRDKSILILEPCDVLRVQDEVLFQKARHAKSSVHSPVRTNTATSTKHALHSLSAHAKDSSHRARHARSANNCLCALSEPQKRHTPAKSPQIAASSSAMPAFASWSGSLQGESFGFSRKEKILGSIIATVAWVIYVALIVVQ